MNKTILPIVRHRPSLKASPKSSSDQGSRPLEFDHAARLFNGKFQVGIGVYDGLSALLAAKWKFDFVWISSFCCSAALGLPDAGIIGPDEILSVVRCVRRCIDLPILIDLDSGYGDAVKVFHVMEAMARAGHRFHDVKHIHGVTVAGVQVNEDG